MKHLFIVFSGLLFIFFCAKYPAVKEKEIQPSLHIRSLEKVKELAAGACGSCHTSGLETSKPAALKVFDLNDSDWMKNMNEIQLSRTFIQRLGFTVQKKDRETVTDCLGEELYLRKNKNVKKAAF